ncbi:hypothetical protein [Streptomyces ambofaciens]|uniref:hypothetical protein n=1 Tax=Streptomyces ambofaciens TaxID=1889 RepID=UPI00131C0A7E|nr:hypothetical protein [Streptomyces ambofaciens]
MNVARRATTRGGPVTEVAAGPTPRPPPATAGGTTRARSPRRETDGTVTGRTDGDVPRPLRPVSR